MAPQRGRPRLVTLTSDVGAAYSAQMKAVLVRSLDPSRLVELTHDLPAHAVGEAAFVLRAMARRFPPGTVHLVVVDPGVGGRRAPIVIACRDGSFLVGPDNGVLYPLAAVLGIREVRRIRPRPEDSAVRVGTTFDGRDVFAPAAARLALGERAAALGPRHRPHPLRVPSAVRTADGGRGEVVHVDHFGNLITNVPSEWVPPSAEWIAVFVGRSRPRRVRKALSYEALGRGGLGVLASSFGTLELAVAEGRAERRLRVGTGTPIRLDWTAVRGR